MLFNNILNLDFLVQELCLPKLTQMSKQNFKKKLEPRLEEAKAGRRAVFFVDAAHFVFGVKVAVRCSKSSVRGCL